MKIHLNYFRFTITSLPIILIAVLFLMALNNYTGEKMQYVIFSLLSFALLYFGLRQRASFAFFFLSIFLWLGFWFKLTIHTIFSYPFVEPIGTFGGSGIEWDQLLVTADLAFGGVISSGLIVFRFLKSEDSRVHNFFASSAPWWYCHSRKYLWTILLFLIVFVAIFNVYYGVHQIGLRERTIFFWPVNALITWLLNIGFATGLATLLWWDLSLSRKATLPFYGVLFESLSSSVSMMSRAAYVFHVLPQLYATKEYIISWKFFKKISLIVIFSLGLVLSISLVSTLRNYFYQPNYLMSTEYQVLYARWEVLESTKDVIIKEMISTREAPEEFRMLQKRLDDVIQELSIITPKLDAAKKRFTDLQGAKNSQIYMLANEFGYQLANGSAVRIFQLAIDRWVGLEGLMATEAYPDKSLDLFWSSLAQGSESNSYDAYQKISASIYMKSSDQFRFRSLPGMVGYLNFSGYRTVVFLGLFLVVSALIIAEKVLSYTAENPIITSLYSAELANNIAQFGGDPKQTLRYLMVLSIGVLMIWFLNSRLLNKCLAHVGITPSQDEVRVKN